MRRHKTFGRCFGTLRRGWSLQSWLLLVVIGSLALGLLINTAISVTRQLIRSDEQHSEEAIWQAESIAVAARSQLELRHFLSLGEMLGDTVGRGGISGILVFDAPSSFVVDAAGGLPVRTESPPAIAVQAMTGGQPLTEQRYGLLRTAVPIFDEDGSARGAVVTMSRMPDLWDQVLTISLPAIVALAAAVLLLVPVAIRASRRVSRLLQAMSHMASEIALGNFGSALPSTRVREARQLGRALRRMAHRLQTQMVRINELAYVDQTTGLPNREFIRQSFDKVFKSRRQHVGAMLFIDLDRFKTINDTLGHDAGDALLKEVSHRLTESVRVDDLVGPSPQQQNGGVDAARSSGRYSGTLARLGGDEFTILLRDLDRPENAAAVARRIIAAVGEPYTIHDTTVHVGASIGIAVYPDDGADFATLMKHADLAMYAAKQAGRNGYAYFSHDMNVHVQHRAKVEAEMRAGLQRDEFRPYYQPKVETGTGRPVGVEALVRWQHPERGWLAPGEFLSIAEENGLVADIGMAVLRQACRDAARWAAQGRPIPVAVNVSQAQFDNEGFAAGVLAVLREVGLDPRLLELELTESTAMTDPERVALAVAPLKAEGIRLAIDDFGTGYSSLSHLTKLPFDTFKIDRSFIANLGVDADSAVIVRTILSMAASLNYTPVAEGVETEEQVAFLRECGCATAQGFHFARPMPVEALESWLVDTERRAAEAAHAADGDVVRLMPRRAV
ncbi:MAG: EAL domain-containing protein [Alphaproteobacteria bacterium]